MFLVITRKILVGTRNFLVITRTFLVGTRIFLVVTRKNLVGTRIFLVVTRKISRRNENISRTNEKNSRTNEKLSKQKKCDLFTSVNLSLLNRIKLSLQYKAIIIIVRYYKTGRTWYCNLRFPQRAPTTKENIRICFNPVINEALRRVNNGYSFYDKIKSIWLQIHKR